MSMFGSALRSSLDDMKVLECRLRLLDMAEMREKLKTPSTPVCMTATSTF